MTGPPSLGIVEGPQKEGGAMSCSCSGKHPHASGHTCVPAALETLREMAEGSWAASNGFLQILSAGVPMCQHID